MNALTQRTLLIAAAAAGLVAASAGAHGARQTVTEDEQWERSYAFAAATAPRLRVRNVWGNVHVTSHGGDTIVVRAHEQRRAASERDLATLPEQLWLEVLELDDALELTVEGTHRKDDWWQRCKGCELHVDLEIQVPEDASVDVATVMDGTVRVSGVTGRVEAHNVNGDLDVTGVHRCGGFKTVNGELDVAFAAPPADDCEFATVNGDMTVFLPSDSQLDARFDLFNGDIRSDFEVDALPVAPKVEKASSGDGTRFKVSKDLGLRIGAGGPAFHFESINGDVHIRRR